MHLKLADAGEKKGELRRRKRTEWKGSDVMRERELGNGLEIMRE